MRRKKLSASRKTKATTGNNSLSKAENELQALMLRDRKKDDRQ